MCRCCPLLLPSDLCAGDCDKKSSAAHRATEGENPDDGVAGGGGGDRDWDKCTLLLSSLELNIGLRRPCMHLDWEWAWPSRIDMIDDDGIEGCSKRVRSASDIKNKQK
eukprot:PhM_4_TR4756/c0_g1_i1/m.69315